MTEKDEPVLILYLDDQLKARIVPERELPEIMKFCYLRDSRGWIGFYDWLRFSGSIIGLRCNPASSERVVGIEFSRSYAHSLESFGVEIFFNNERRVDQYASSDQGFGHNEKWVSEAGDIALTVALGDLQEAELKQVVEWAQNNMPDIVF